MFSRLYFSGLSLSGADIIQLKTACGCRLRLIAKYRGRIQSVQDHFGEFGHNRSCRDVDGVDIGVNARMSMALDADAVDSQERSTIGMLVAQGPEGPLHCEKRRGQIPETVAIFLHHFGGALCCLQGDVTDEAVSQSNVYLQILQQLVGLEVRFAQAKQPFL